MVAIVKNLFLGFWVFLKIPILICLFLAVLFFVLVFINVLTLLCQGVTLKKAPKGTFRKQKKHSVIYRLLFLFPRRVARDWLEKDPSIFPDQGMIIFTGRQGMGKTIAMTEYVYRMQQTYPLLKVTTNYGYKTEDLYLNHWKRLIDFNNGRSGVIAGLDELQNWFSSNASRNFPPEMLQVITQNRKNRRVIVGTAQNFYLLAKPLRTQTTEVRECFTILRCLTIVHRREPILDVSGDVRTYKNRGWYFFVHSDEVRNSYDTYKVINNLKKSGFYKSSLDEAEVQVVAPAAAK